MSIDELATKQGKLAELLPLFDPDSIQHADEITTARRTDKSLRKMWFWTGDGSIYSVKDGEAYLSLTRRQHNPVFNNIEEAARQLLSEDHNYRPPQKDVETALEAEDTLTVKISDLELKKLDEEFGYFEIDTENYDSLNPAQRAVAERAYGSGKEFEDNMKLLREGQINKTRVYVLNQNYVLDNVEEGEAVSRACWLGYFINDSGFGADGRDVGGSLGCLRGVLNKVAEGDAPKKLVSLPEDELQNFVTKYVPEDRLNEARKELAELHQ